jgi:hypothetical protein
LAGDLLLHFLVQVHPDPQIGDVSPSVASLQRSWRP